MTAGETEDPPATGIMISPVTATREENRENVRREEAAQFRLRRWKDRNRRDLKAKARTITRRKITAEMTMTRE